MFQRNIDKVIVVAALAAAATTLLPVAKSTLRPLLAGGLELGEGLMKRTKSIVQIAKEELEDIVAEAQFERMKKQLDKEIASISQGAD